MRSLSSLAGLGLAATLVHRLDAIIVVVIRPGQTEVKKCTGWSVGRWPLAAHSPMSLLMLMPLMVVRRLFEAKAARLNEG